VLNFVSDVMRGESEATASQLKAAEILGKHYALWQGSGQWDDRQSVTFTGEDELKN